MASTLQFTPNVNIEGTVFQRYLIFFIIFQNSFLLDLTLTETNNIYILMTMFLAPILTHSFSPLLFLLLLIICADFLQICLESWVQIVLSCKTIKWVWILEVFSILIWNYDLRFIHRLSYSIHSLFTASSPTL